MLRAILNHYNEIPFKLLENPVMEEDSVEVISMLSRWPSEQHLWPAATTDNHPTAMETSVSAPQHTRSSQAPASCEPLLQGALWVQETLDNDSNGVAGTSAMREHDLATASTTT
jgi:hypothetical protein